MTTIKKYKKLPVHIVEDHNDVLYHILRAVGSKHLPFTGNLMIHFDSHPDLLIPPDLKASEVFDVTLMLEKLSIENWILVAAYAGQISTIVWIKPQWSNQIDEGTYKFLIGNQKGTDNIRVSSTVLYFVGEMLYCQASELENTKEVTLKVVTLKEGSSVTLEQDLLHMIEEHNNFYILDIDLDFFTTMNPFISMHEQVNMYSRLKKAYCFKFEETHNEESLQKQMQKRYHQITSLKNIFSHIQELQEPEMIQREVSSVCETIEGKEERKSIVQLIGDLASTYGDKVDWGLVHDAGCTWDDEKHQLPHHVSSEKEIDLLVKKFSKQIIRFPTPTLVTIARSSLDDYCPPDQVDSVQERVCEILCKAYDVDCKKHYEDGSN